MIKRSITTKLTIGFVIIIIISTLCIGIIGINIFRNNIFAMKEKNITLHAQKLESRLEPYIENGVDSKEYKDILKGVSSFDNTKVWMINLKGEIRTIYEKEDNVLKKNKDIQEVYAEIITSALGGKLKSMQGYNAYYDENMMSVAVPIAKGDKSIIGVIIVHSSTIDLSNSMNEFFIYLIAAVIGEVIIAGLLGFYFSKNITKPIKIINEAAMQMTEGNFKLKTNIYQKDEIGELSTSFDILSSRLEYNIGQQEKLEQMRKDFVANVSHEFRTPLTIIRGNLEGLYEGVIPMEEHHDNYVTLIKETKRLEAMVADLLSLSKLESGKVELNLQKLDIKEILRDITRVLKPITKAKNIELELIDEGNLPPVWSDYDKLKQLLIIFIDNAIKFSHVNSKIKLAIILEKINQEDTLSITITDYGIGISKEDIPFIGERFYKADKARKYSGNSTGLGISIAKHLIKILNCELKIKSQINVGTQIKIKFLKFKEEIHL
ncbi:cell wall metabolism sensor histidine kinase WalK [Clostridium estertheticum]|uniref:sensor histidine kinase n=1 Tax=Clostridium estertheticum TaxID=238834 RepID=UPI001CF551B5|nr:ATP-binding protein [Clostridium estertheticum]MCB2305118.1 cell wall metabolism sensor histidine kinase WalK [Clostridium estertheticum]MCB2343612.1 cell wall metabolism sensor histidine kinase WalK [Clostridium estertheticum]MCB2348532.1 cell wall metabolism sensor histidine kinase WalK [Clostridium estertheticum]WAG47476.1 cell wall metabolism sensor histidine kinase WalK [Clostridium estertheticum]